MKKTPQKKILLWFLLFLAVIATGVQLAFFLYEQQEKSKGLVVLKDISSKINTTSFEPLFTASARLAKHELIVSTIKGKQKPDNQETINLLVNTRYLLDSSLVYLLNSKGNTVACTPYSNGQKTLTGKNYAFRPYFIEPMTNGKPFSYIALGVTTGKPGIYHATPVMDKDEVIGVLVVKVSLRTINQALRKCSFPIAMLNDKGIIIASNNNSWLYHAGFRLEEKIRQEIIASRQFSDEPLQPLSFDLTEEKVTLNQQEYLGFIQPIGLDNWSIAFLYLPATRPVFFFLKYTTLIALLALFLFFGILLFRSRRESILALRVREAEYRSIISHMPVAFFRIDLSRKVILASPAILKLYGSDDLSDIVGKSIVYLLFLRDNRKNFLEQIEEDGELRDYECFFRRKDGSSLEVLVNASFYYNAEGHKDGIEGTFYDISERIKMESKLHLLSGAVEASANAIVITDVDGKISWVNKSFTELTGFDSKDVTGITLNILSSGIHDDTFFKQLWETILQGKIWHGELQNKHKDGHIYHEEMTITPIHDHFGSICNFIAVKCDISARKKAEEERENYLQNEKILSEVARALLGGVINKQSFLDVLEKIRTAIDVSRVVVFKVVDGSVDDKCISLLYGAYDPAEPHEDFITNFNHYACRQESHWYHCMEKGIAFTSPDGNDNWKPPLFSKSLLTVPFFDEDTWAGFFAIDDTTKTRTWSSSEISFATTVAEILGSYFVRTATTKKLAHEREQSDSANRAKSSFLANMSHEIRTPMNAIIGMTHLALETALTSQQQTYIQSAQTAAQDLLTIINEILDFSKIEEGMMQLVDMPFLLQDVVDSTILLITNKAAEKGIKLETDLTLPPFELIGDSHKLGQILLNLCDNAVKYTEQGTVRLKISWQQNTDDCLISIAVEDTGIGIEPDVQGILFHAFTQADASITRKYGGTGLGLTICSKLVKLMGGKLELQSSPGHGSLFSFALNFKVGNALTKSPPLARLTTHSEDVPDTIYAELTVLLVEDNEFNQMLATELLKKQNATVTIAVNGQEAIDKIKEKTFDLVLMDVQMPVLDGLEATRQIRSLNDSYFKNVPIIAMTANAVSGDREQCLDAGMTGYLSKPFEPNSFYAEITQYQKTPPIATETPSLTVLDTACGLQRLQENKDLQVKMLGNFINEFKHYHTEMEKAFLKDDLKTLLRLVHTLKGAAGTIGGFRLQNMCMQFEKLLQNDSQQLDISKEINATKQGLTTLFEAINSFLDENTKKQEDALPQNSLQELHILLTEFSPVIGQAKIAYSKELTSRLAKYSWPHQTRSAIEKLLKALNEYNFKAAKSVLDTLLEEISR